MTKKEVVSVFSKWIESTPTLSASVERRSVGKGEAYSVFKVMESTESGTPWTTVCMDILPGHPALDDGWYDIIKRKCAGELAIDQFSEVGVGECSSPEEFTLKLEIAKLGKDRP